MVYNNLMSLHMLDTARDAFSRAGLDLAAFEDIEDAALGNGGLGRLAACFLDSAATHDLPLDGYGIRYKFGLFKQSFRDGFQVESADDWQRMGDPWSIRRDTHTVTVQFAGQTVRAVAYDMPIIGYGTDNIGTLRLWQSEAIEEFDFQAFNEQQYALAVREKNAVEDITRVLYPNDSTYAGKQLRLKQQYFLSSASLQDILFNFKRAHGDLSKLADMVAIQLNDTHPVVSIPELIRLLMAEGWSFDDALSATKRIFSYTNHTVMAEAMEKWTGGCSNPYCPTYSTSYTASTALLGELMQWGCRASRGIHFTGRAAFGILASLLLAHHQRRGALNTEYSRRSVKHFTKLSPSASEQDHRHHAARWLKLCTRSFPPISPSEWAKAGSRKSRRAQRAQSQYGGRGLPTFNASSIREEQLRVSAQGGGVLLPRIFYLTAGQAHARYKRQI
jgi:starch phosphorylase